MWADEGAGGVWVWGGTREKGRGTESLSDLWFLHLATLAWQKVEAGGVGPGARSSVGACVVGDKVMLFGGVTGKEGGEDTWHGDVCVFDMKSRAWEGAKAGGGIGPRRSAGVCAEGGVMYVVGGLREEGQGEKEKEVTLDDAWRVDVGEGGAGKWQCFVQATGGGEWVEESSSDEGEEGHD